MKKTEYTYSLKPDSIADMTGKIREFLEENRTDADISKKSVQRHRRSSDEHCEAGEGK